MTGKLTGRSPGGVKERLRDVSNRMTGGRAVNMRQEAVPAAYRIFFRQIGIDPDVTRTPPEHAALERMRHGGFRSYGLIWDAVTIATVETGVGVLPFDADTRHGGTRPTPGAPGETLGQTELVEGEGAGRCRTARSCWPTRTARWPSCSAGPRPSTR